MIPYTIYPFHRHILDLAREIGGQHCGIIDAMFARSSLLTGCPRLTSIFGHLPNYHKVLLGENRDIQYHLTGYGTYFEEAFIRLIGESIERYALVAAPPLFTTRIEYASFQEIRSRGETVPFDLLRIYSDSDYDALEPISPWRRITETDIIGWIRCPSLFERDKEVYVPTQCMFVGQKYVFPASPDETLFLPSFSKGTSAHGTFQKALSGAILETLEIDSAMLSWYTDCPSARVIVDDPAVNGLLDHIMKDMRDYDIVALAPTITAGVCHAFIVALAHKHKGTPFAVFSSNAALEPLQGLYRAITEAAATFPFVRNAIVYHPEYCFQHITKKPFTDLDSNAMHYARAEDPAITRKLIHDMIEGTVHLSDCRNFSEHDEEKDLHFLIRQLKSRLNYGVYLDITPPEVADKGWRVARVFFPELLQMCLPGFPYSNHPRIKRFGGITNPYPHPFP